VAFEADLSLDLETVIPLEILMILQPPLLDLHFPVFTLCFTSSLPIKFFWIVHKTFWVCWRGSRPSPVRVSNKQNIYKNIKRNLQSRVSQKLD
jgi:hypothetical protein